MATFLPSVLLWGGSAASSTYSAKLGGIGLTFLVVGIAGGIGMSLRMLIEAFIGLPGKLLPAAAIDLAILQLFSGMGLMLSAWYVWSWVGLQVGLDEVVP